MKRELLQDLSALQLTKLDVANEANWVPVMDADIGLGAESFLKVIFICSICKKKYACCAVHQSDQLRVHVKRFIVSHIFCSTHNSCYCCSSSSYIVLKRKHFFLLIYSFLHHVFKVHILQSKPGSSVGERSVLIFRRECIQSLVTMIKKLQEKSPLKFPVVRAIACLDPTNMHKDPGWCLTKMKTTVQKLLQDCQLTGGISAGRKNIE